MYTINVVVLKMQIKSSNASGQLSPLPTAAVRGRIKTGRRAFETGNPRRSRRVKGRIKTGSRGVQDG